MSSTKLLTTVTRHVRLPPTLRSCPHHHRRSVHKLSSLPQSFQFITISPEIQTALQRGAPVVALESANITCPALPEPHNTEYATKVEREIRKMGAIPATMMVLAGRVHVGVEDPALYYDMARRATMKVSQRELPYVLGMVWLLRRRSGGLTVSAALTIASMIGIKVLATGAIGGVHRSATTLMDISADINELGRRNVAVVCSGPKVYMDAEGTIEYLETKGVPVATFGGGAMEVKLPAHYSTEGVLQSPLVLKDAKDAARMIYTSHQWGLETGQLLCNPIPYENQLNLEIVEKSVHKYFKERKKHSKKDKEVVEKIVSTIRQFNNRDRTVAAEKVMLMHNARVAAQVAVELAHLEMGTDWFVIHSS
ncbi:Indigoidine synthase A like protein [Morchella conica CCBAS932]|uniref:Indigoidine synthase A like protein n=1 Tax=Morchella conica CCBAS932 TaxID=1392247 RepID=A0A3N4KYW7_9PEZI|nr:Indigoidine synthase A like protein [Morchella conica CCBAS932]